MDIKQELEAIAALTEAYTTIMQANPRLSEYQLNKTLDTIEALSNRITQKVKVTPVVQEEP